MKKFLPLILIVTLIFIGSTRGAYAAAELPSTSVWFAPASAAAGDSVTLNALVYNGQSVDATMTIAFTAGTIKIGTVTETVSAQSAKTISVAWNMPAKNTVVTATVSTAVDAKKKSIPSLVGTIGTVTVGPTATPLVTTSSASFPGSTQLSAIGAWFTPFIAQAEVFRIKEAAHYATARDEARLKVGVTTTPTTVSTEPETPAPATEGVTGTGPQNQDLASKALGNPLDWGTLIWATSLATLFASQALFYIGAILLILLVLRFIVNLIF